MAADGSAWASGGTFACFEIAVDAADIIRGKNSWVCQSGESARAAAPAPRAAT